MLTMASLSTFDSATLAKATSSSCHWRGGQRRGVSPGRSRTHSSRRTTGQELHWEMAAEKVGPHRQSNSYITGIVPQKKAPKPRSDDQRVYLRRCLREGFSPRPAPGSQLRQMCREQPPHPLPREDVAKRPHERCVTLQRAVMRLRVTHLRRGSRAPQQRVVLVSSLAGLHLLLVYIFPMGVRVVDLLGHVVPLLPSSVRRSVSWRHRHRPLLSLQFLAPAWGRGA